MQPTGPAPGCGEQPRAGWWCKVRTPLPTQRRPALPLHPPHPAQAQGLILAHVPILTLTFPCPSPGPQPCRRQQLSPHRPRPCPRNVCVGKGRASLVIGPSRCHHPPSHFHLVISAGLPDLCHPPPWVPSCHMLFSFTHVALPRSHLHARSQHVCHFTLSHPSSLHTRKHTHTHTLSPPEACGPSAVDQVILSILLSWDSAVSVNWAWRSILGAGAVLWLFPPGELGRRWERAELGT